MFRSDGGSFSISLPMANRSLCTWRIWGRWAPKSSAVGCGSRRGSFAPLTIVVSTASGAAGRVRMSRQLYPDCQSLA